MLSQSEQESGLSLTSVGQGDTAFPQGRTGSIVNSGVIYHITIFHLYPGGSGKEINSCFYCGGFAQSCLQLEKDRVTFQNTLQT